METSSQVAGPASWASTAANDRVTAWVEVYGPSVLRLAYAFLRDRQQAEDVFQEVFLKAHQHAARLQDETRVRPASCPRRLRAEMPKVTAHTSRSG